MSKAEELGDKLTTKEVRLSLLQTRLAGCNPLTTNPRSRREPQNASKSNHGLGHSTHLF